MKVLHYSDIGEDNISAMYKEAELFITTGDLRYSDFRGIREVAEKLPSFGVYGNHDDGSSYLADNSIFNLHYTAVEHNGLLLGGFQGCLRYNMRDIQYTEDEAKDFADNFPYVDMLVLHAGPLGLLDDPSDSVHIGSVNIRRYVDEKRPKFIFCGHQYSNAEMVHNSTKVFRTYGARFIEI